MLTATRVSDNIKVLARDAARCEAPFKCAGCSEILILRKGSCRIHHFAHKPPVSCAYGMGETAAHYEAKLGIYEALRQNPNVKNADLEKQLNGQIADVYAEINGIPVAIEIQRSQITVEAISSRTAAYHAQRIAVIWLIPTMPAVTDGIVAPSSMEKWLHAAYFGRVYYWRGGSQIQPIHFNTHARYIEANDYGGGHWKNYRRYKKTTAW